MPDWPKSFHTFGVNLRTAAMEWRLRKKRGAVAQQERCFAALLAPLARAAVWREAGVEAGMRYEKFRARVAPRTYEQLAPEIGRMRRGEADVLWPGRCAFFATTPGTTGAPKFLPVTEEHLAHVRRASYDALLYYTVRARHAAVVRGRHLWLGAPAELVPLEEAKPAAAFAGDLAGIATLGLPAWVERHVFEPDPAAALLADWDARLAAIIARTKTRDVTLLAGLPTAALHLAYALGEDAWAAKRRLRDLEALWPNLECLVHHGQSAAPYRDELRTLLGPTVRLHEVYAAAEGFIATQDGEPAAGLRLMADAGVFFEFIPMADYDEARLDRLGEKAVPLAGVQAGVDYAVLLTTPAGLVRYALGDVVRFVTTAPPRLVPVGRTRLWLDAFGEHVHERQLTDALALHCQRHAWRVVNFHVAPLFARGNTLQTRGRHEWWIELQPGTVTTPTGPALAAALDADLARLAPRYAERRQSGLIDAPYVRLVMPGVFEHWQRFHTRWGGAHRIPRCRSDRLIADEMAGITNFAAD
ncbi:MAG: hypothetical protein RLZZ15_4526 [Verrucomicrobiota bacterium]|jgi:hypothetical protein